MAPVAAPVALATGAALSYGTEKGAQALGVPKEYAALLGDVANLVGGAFGPKAVAGLLSRMKISPSGPLAEVVKFADDHGIPISAAARTGMERIRQFQARSASSKAAQRSQARTQAAMTRTAEQLRGAPPTPPAAAGAAPPAPPPEAFRATPTPPAAAGAPPPTPPSGGPRVTREAVGAQVAGELRATSARYGAGESAAYKRLEEIEAANAQPVVTGTRQIPAARPEARLTPAGMPQTEQVTEMIGLPVNLETAKTRLGPLIAEVEQQLPPALREQSVGLQALRNLQDAPGTVSATVADGYLSAIKTLLRSRSINPKSRRLLREALDAVSPAVDQAVAQGGPEAVQRLSEGRQLTAAKYAAERTMRSLRIPKRDEFPLEPVRLFRKLTAPGDVNIGLLERVKQDAPNSIPAVRQTLLEGLFDTALGRDGKLDPAAARRAWNRMGDATKRLLVDDPKQIPPIDDFFRESAVRHMLDPLFDSALGREGNLDPMAALRKWNAVDAAARRDLPPAQVNELNNFFRESASHHLLGELFDLALGRQGKLDPAAALRKWNATDDALKQSLLAPPQIAKVGRFLREATEHDFLQPLFDLALGRDGKLDPMAALRKWNALHQPAPLTQQASEIGRFLREAARQDQLDGLFDLALGRKGTLNPAQALRGWNAIDPPTRRMLGIQPKEEVNLDLFFRLAEHEGQTPRAGGGPTSGGGLHWFDLLMATAPEVAGHFAGHLKAGAGVALGYGVLRGGKALASRGLAQLLWDPQTARMLTEGIRVPLVSVPGAVGAATTRETARELSQRTGEVPPSRGRAAAAPAARDGGRGSPTQEGKGSPFSPRAGLTPEIQGLLAKASRQHGVPLDLLTQVVSRESRGNPGAVSPKGAVGVMQLMPATAADLGLKESELTDPAKNIDAGARYLRQLLDDNHWDRKLALAAYNAGPGAVKKYGGVPPYKETQQYVRGVR
jgi:hypothetical protein